MKDRQKSSEAERALLGRQQWSERANTVPVMLYNSVLAPDGTSRFLDVAPGPCREILGLNPDALLKDMSLLWNIVHPDDLDLFHQEVLAANEAGKEFLTEVRIITPSGDLKWLLVNSKPNPAESGETVVWSGYLQDITARKQAEEKLRETEQRLRLLVEHSTNLFYMHTSDHVLTYVSPQSKLFFNCEPEEAMVRWTELITDNPLNRDAILATQRAIDTGERQSPYQIECIGGKGRTIWVEAHEAPIVENGVTIGISGTLTDITEKKKTEEALYASRNLLHTVLENVPTRVFWKDADLNYLGCNTAFARSAGFSKPEDLLGKNDLQMCWHDQVEEIQADDKRIMNTETPGIGIEKPLPAPDGKMTWVRTSKAPMYDKEGTVIGMLGTDEDITERKLAEESQNKDRAFIDSTLDSITDLFYAFDLNGKFIRWNNTFAIISGYSDQELALMKPQDFFLDDDLPQISEAIEKVYKEGSSKEEARFVTQDGRRILCEFTGSVLKDGNGNVLGFSGTGRDITERKQSEELLRESEAELKRAQEIGHIGSWEWDIPANKNRWSEEMYRICGIDPNAEIRTEDVMALINPEDLWKQERAITASFAGQSVEPFDYRLIRPDGEERIVEVTGIRTEFDENGQALKMYGVAQDITERRAAEKNRTSLENQLQQAQKIESIGQLAGGVAHDFNNMLGVILGHAELAKRKSEHAKPVINDLEEICTAAKRSADLTQKLLTFARKQPITPKVLDLNETITGTLSMLQRMIGENIQLSWNPASNLWPAEMDPSQLDQILANLCINASHAVGEHGKISIKTCNTSFCGSDLKNHPEVLPGNYVQLSVSDDGHGIDEDVLPQIFEPFFTTKKADQGTGLGLATVFGAVKQNKGFIEVLSTLGQGTTFRIFLPRAATELVDETETSATPHVGGDETILLVEDDEMLLNLVASMLDECGYQVLPASTTKQAVSLTKDHEGPIHLVLSDMIMPEMNGRNLRDKLQEIRPKLKVLFMSGYSYEIISSQGIMEKGMHFLQKPASLEELTTKVREVLSQD